MDREQNVRWMCADCGAHVVRRDAHECSVCGGSTLRRVGTSRFEKRHDRPVGMRRAERQKLPRQR
jgi:rRNA maturation endonuclease Nob1